MSDPVAPKRAPIGRIFAILFVVIVLVGIAPVLLAFSASLIADAAGCVLNEGGINPCLIGGVDVGDTLAVLFMTHWLALMTLPVAGLALVVWLVALVVTLLLRWQRSAK